jgi:N-carbamoylputrescine amidase
VEIYRKNKSDGKRGFVNRTGEEEGMKYFGHSPVVSPQGKIIAQAGSEECIPIANIDLSEIDSSIVQSAFMRDRRPEIYSRLIDVV